MKVIYLDNNATTRTLPEVLQKMTPYFTDFYGNASSIHTFGGSNKHAIEAARAQVAALLHADSEEIIFTSGGTEGDSTAIFAAVNAHRKKNHIITSAVEHPAVLEACKYLALRGYRLDIIGVNEKGRFNMEQYKSVLDEDTALVTTMWANSETGTIFPVKEIAALAHAKGALFHTDAVQAAGKIPTDVKEIDADFVSMSSHKINGPKGTGALYVKKGINFMPFMRGGHQENLRRAGTENVPNIVGLGYAAELALKHLPEYTIHVKPLRDLLEKELVSQIPDTKINGDTENRLPNTTNLSFGYVEGESILMFLDEHGICASSGSACTTGSLEPSHVLRAMGVPFQFAHGSVRFSLSRFTTLEEVQTVIKVLPGIIARLREISPFKKGLN